MLAAYPAVIQEAADGFSVTFPDIDGCFTCGESLTDAMEMAEDALCLMLYDMEESGEAIPQASDIRQIQVSDDELVTLIVCDTVEYRKLYTEDVRDLKAYEEAMEEYRKNPVTYSHEDVSKLI